MRAIIIPILLFGTTVTITVGCGSRDRHSDHVGKSADLNTSSADDGTWETSGNVKEPDSPLPATPAVSKSDVESTDAFSPRGDMAEGADRLSSDATGTAGQTPPPGLGVLTAGSLADTLNVSDFSNFWKTSELASAQLSFPQDDGERVDFKADLSSDDWQKLIPSRSNSGKSALDLVLLIDVTGSMGDEFEYLKTELAGIIDTVKSDHPDTAVRIGVIVYKDRGDEFVTRGIPLTGDLDSVQKFLAAQSAGGGGDYPEALQVALSEAGSKLLWGVDAAKLIFLIADAPPHPEDYGAAFSALEKLRAQDVVVDAIAGSGAEIDAETVLRTLSFLTGGDYSWLTDDSGVGDAHTPPHFPCYDVVKLNDLMVRLINQELTGQRQDPEPSSIIRTVGHPVEGVCESQ